MTPFAAPAGSACSGARRSRRALAFSRPAYNEKKLAMASDRMSISGIQTKISLRLKGGQLEMVESGGEFILKPIPQGTFQRLEAVPINEHLTMQIARQVFKIDVAENALVQFADGEVAYLVRRFDIQPNGKRLLQEDFAQIASRSEETHGPNYKYDFSYEEIGDLIRHARRRIRSGPGTVLHAGRVQLSCEQRGRPHEEFLAYPIRGHRGIQVDPSIRSPEHAPAPAERITNCARIIQGQFRD